MADRRPLSGKEVAAALHEMGYQVSRQSGSHVILVYKNPQTGEKRTVSVPLHNELSTNTLHSIAKQCGAKKFQRWLDWIHDIVN